MVSPLERGQAGAVKDKTVIASDLMTMSTEPVTAAMLASMAWRSSGLPTWKGEAEMLSKISPPGGAAPRPDRVIQAALPEALSFHTSRRW